jgi:uncharacterized protein (TIGR02996 family)
MSQREAFLAAIRDEPDDDTHRLVYADWLTDHGDERDVGRAEFIRTQVAAERLPERDPERRRLEAWALELRDAHSDAWFSTMPQEFRPVRLTFRRGFFDALHLDPDFLDKYAAILFEREPVRRLLMGWGRLPAGGPGDWPWLVGIRDLDLSGVSHIDPGEAAFLGSPHLSGLRHLRLTFLYRDTARIKAVAANAALSGLTHLTLTGLWEHGDTIVTALADVRNLTRLTDLDFVSNGIGPAGAQALARAPILRNLTRLTFRDDSSTRPRIGDEGLTALLGSPHLPQLTELGVDQQDLTDDSVIALAENPKAARLMRLSLQLNRIGAAGCEAIGSSAQLASLEELNLTNTALGDDGVEALARGTTLRRLRRLDLQGGANCVGNRGAIALAASPMLAGLRVLNLEWNSGIGPAGARALAESPYLTQLEELILDHAPIGTEGAIALAKSANLRHLRHLSLQLTGIGDAGAKALAKSPHLTNLRTLLLGGCDLHAAGARAIAESRYLQGVTWLNLDGNPMRRATRQALERD